MPDPDVSSGFDEGKFTYEDYDDMFRDVRNHAFNQDLSSPSPDLVIGDPSICERLDNIRETTGCDLGISPANSSSPNLLKVHRVLLLLGERALVLLRGKILLHLGELFPQGQVRNRRRLVLGHRVLHRLVRLVQRRPVQGRVVDVLHLEEVLNRVADVLHLAEELHLAVDWWYYVATSCN